MIEIASIVRDPANQVRRALDDALVRSYATAFEQEANFPPIRVAAINAGLILYDGWHRLAAQQALGWQKVWVEIALVEDLREIKWLAAQANLTHGKRLNKGEMRTVFRSFIRARKHRKGVGGFKSYREIGKDLCGIGHTTLRNWMRSDFPKTFNRMGGHSEGGGGAWGKDYDDGDAEENLVAIADKQLQEALSAFRAVSSPDHRAAIAYQTRSLLERMEGDVGTWVDGTILTEWYERHRIACRDVL